MALVRDGDFKERHDAIAQDLVYRALEAVHGVQHQVKGGIEELLGGFGVEWRDKFHRPAVTRSCGLSGRSRNRVNNGQWDAFAAYLSGLPPEQLRHLDGQPRTVR